MERSVCLDVTVQHSARGMIRLSYGAWCGGPGFGADVATGGFDIIMFLAAFGVLPGLRRFIY